MWKPSIVAGDQRAVDCSPELASSAGAAGEGAGDDFANNLCSDLETYVSHVTPDIDKEVKDRRACTQLYLAAAKGHPESV